MEKVFTDRWDDELKVSHTDPGDDGGEPSVFVRVDLTGAAPRFADVELSPKKARKVALAILAAADEAEGVTEAKTVVQGEDIEGWGPSPWSAEVAPTSGGGAWVGAGRDGDRVGPNLDRKTAKALLFGLARALRSEKP